MPGCLSSKSSHFFHFGINFPDELFLTEPSGKSTFVIYDLPVDDCRVDILFGRGIYYGRLRVNHLSGLMGF